MLHSDGCTLYSDVSLLAELFADPDICVSVLTLKCSGDVRWECWYYLQALLSANDDFESRDHTWGHFLTIKFNQNKQKKQKAIG